jgi:hypothetical protein
MLQTVKPPNRINITCQQESVTITKGAFSFFKTYNEVKKKIQRIV